MKTVLSCLAILLVFLFWLHIRFPLSLSVSEHHNLFLSSSTYEFIFLLKSSRSFLFFVFNVIVIVIIFFGSFKSSFKEDFAYCAVSFPTSAYEASYDGNDHYCEYYSEDADEDEEYYHGSDGYDEDNEHDDNDDGSFYGFDDDEYGEEEIDIDLKRRIEEFISKVNETWREELRSEKLLRIAMY
ncbi:uncharacterized protein LOC107435675 [Ziziphus jujuba]|uniref:Uncharacterized protein LOC107435675 n=1 Tax=Ziziphus jujuba TaxID=326968 RepID=A0A6P4BIB1_ZIZJJ|nr:uncharacterized protein LOC107435675 [Ziziphus jujuba]